MYRTLWQPPPPAGVRAAATSIDRWSSWSRTLQLRAAQGPEEVAWTIRGEAKHERAYREMVSKGAGRAESNKRRREEGKMVMGRGEAIQHPMRCRKVRLFPSKEQETTIRSWMGGARQVYNMAIDTFSSLGYDNFMELRGYINSFIDSEETHAFLKSVPDKVRAGAVKDLVTAVKAASTNKRRRRIREFSMKYRTKKDKEQSIVIDTSGWRPATPGFVSIFPRLLGGTMPWKDRSASSILKDRNKDCRLTMDSLGHFYLCIPIERDELGGDSQAASAGAPRMSVVALDPGVRTFQTFYSPSGLTGKIGMGAARRVEKLYDHLFDLVRRRKEEKDSRRRGRMKKAVVRMRSKIKNLVDDLHWKACDFLCRTFDTIIIPKFGVLGMVRRGANIRKSVKRSMLALRHFVFRERLIHKARFWGCRVIVSGEAYTSKTCVCGFVHNGLGGSDVFTCPRCNHSCDRDIHASRNILCKNIL